MRMLPAIALRRWTGKFPVTASLFDGIPLGNRSSQRTEAATISK